MTTMKVVPIGAVVGTFQGPNSGSVNMNSDNTLSIDVRDLPYAMEAGYMPAYYDTRWYDPRFAPLAASAAVFVASGALSDGAQTIAAQPDVGRQVQAVVLPGTTAISAGTWALVYNATDGTTQTDTQSLVTAASTNLTLTSSKGAMHIVSSTIAALAGGASPTMQVGSNAVLAVPIPLNAADATLLKEASDGTDQATVGVLTTAGLWTPHVAPNGTHVPSIGFTFVAPA